MVGCVSLPCLPLPLSSTPPGMSCRTPRLIGLAAKVGGRPNLPRPPKGMLAAKSVRSAIPQSTLPNPRAKWPGLPSGSRVGIAARAARALARDFESGSYTYRFTPNTTPPGYSLEVTSGGQSISHPITWTMGVGVHGQTYLLDNKDGLLESQVSSFTFIHRVGLSPGHKPVEEGSLANALGMPLRAGEALRCFACHTTASSANSKLYPEDAVPGLHCEACHGPGLDHVKAAMAGQKAQARQAIFNPASLTPTGSIDFCGACHRTTMDVILHEPAPGAYAIRFQPYRLQESRCWQTTKDARLACTQCHDPHAPMVRDAHFYDQKCLSCHSLRKDARHDVSSAARAAKPKICPKATANCASCHMPRSDVPEMKSTFVDHFIRIVRPGEPVPN